MIILLRLLQVAQGHWIIAGCSERGLERFQRPACAMHGIAWLSESVQHVPNGQHMPLFGLTRSQEHRPANANEAAQPSCLHVMQAWETMRLVGVH